MVNIVFVWILAIGFLTYLIMDMMEMAEENRKEKSKSIIPDELTAWKMKEKQDKIRLVFQRYRESLDPEYAKKVAQRLEKNHDKIMACKRYGCEHELMDLSKNCACKCVGGKRDHKAIFKRKRRNEIDFKYESPIPEAPVEKAYEKAEWGKGEGGKDDPYLFNYNGKVHKSKKGERIQTFVKRVVKEQEEKK